MRYLLVEWLHSLEDEPTKLYSELDDERWERRKVELYRDGRIGFASAKGRSGTTRLSIEPLPILEEIASDPQFRPMEISQEAFEQVWRDSVLTRRGPNPTTSDNPGSRGTNTDSCQVSKRCHAKTGEPVRLATGNNADA